MRIPPQVTVIEHSLAADTGIELVTFHVRYWRPIHSEVMTHRKFGRNARSSRAVPNKVLLREPIVEPWEYGANIPGMQAGAQLTGWRRMLARCTWLALAHVTRAAVRVLHFAGLHKQWSNRPLEWFGQIDVLITATDYKNWYALRDHAAAMPEIQLLARGMREAVEASTPRALRPGEWHLPYVTQSERDTLGLVEQLKVSVARCARISYTPFDGNGDLAAEIERHNKLVVQQPVHASPAEHQASPDVMDPDGNWTKSHLHGNLWGWVQYRKTLPNEWVPG